MADILIRGMELPTDKRVELMVFPNGYVGVYDVRGRYLAHAQAFQLPKGHGKMEWNLIRTWTKTNTWKQTWSGGD